MLDFTNQTGLETTHVACTTMTMSIVFCLDETS